MSLYGQAIVFDTGSVVVLQREDTGSSHYEFTLVCIEEQGAIQKVKVRVLGQLRANSQAPRYNKGDTLTAAWSDLYPLTEEDLERYVKWLSPSKAPEGEIPM